MVSLFTVGKVNISVTLTSSFSSIPNSFAQTELRLIHSFTTFTVGVDTEKYAILLSPYVIWTQLYNVDI